MTLMQRAPRRGRLQRPLGADRSMGRAAAAIGRHQRSGRRPYTPAAAQCWDGSGPPRLLAGLQGGAPADRGQGSGGQGAGSAAPPAGRLQWCAVRTTAPTLLQRSTRVHGPASSNSLREVGTGDSMCRAVVACAGYLRACSSRWPAPAAQARPARQCVQGGWQVLQGEPQAQGGMQVGEQDAAWLHVPHITLPLMCFPCNLEPGYLPKETGWKCGRVPCAHTSCVACTCIGQRKHSRCASLTYPMRAPLPRTRSCAIPPLPPRSSACLMLQWALRHPKARERAGRRAASAKRGSPAGCSASQFAHGRRGVCRHRRWVLPCCRHGLHAPIHTPSWVRCQAGHCCGKFLSEYHLSLGIASCGCGSGEAGARWVLVWAAHSSAQRRPPSR